MPPSVASSLPNGAPSAAANGLAADARAARREALRELRAAPIAGLGFLARAWASVFVVEASLRTLGYRRTLAWIEAAPPARRRRRSASVALGAKLVRGAYRAHAFRGGCLPLSLVQYLLHRRDGTPARFVIGVRRAATNEGRAGGIEAHAWIESAAAPVDPAAGEFAPIVRVGAGASGDDARTVRGLDHANASTNGEQP